VSRLIVIIYVVIGVIIAANRDYFGDVSGFQDILSAILAVLLWPLIILGVDINIGKDGNKKDGALFVGPMVALLAARRRTR
jgi:Mn2+/Fe2+ NRAMP family transporter